MLPDLDMYLGYLAAIALLMITPGPDMMFVITNASRWGPRAGIAAAFGVAAGEAVHMSLAALGLASLLAANPTVFEVIRYAGAAYLVYLGVRAFVGRDQPAEAPSGHSGMWRAFGRGALTNVLNPKMALFSLAFLPQFIDPTRGNVGAQFLVLGATFVVLQIAMDLVLGVVAGRVGERLWRHPRAARGMNTVCGVVFIGLGSRLAIMG